MVFASSCDVPRSSPNPHPTPPGYGSSSQHLGTPLKYSWMWMKESHRASQMQHCRMAQLPTCGGTVGSQYYTHCCCWDLMLLGPYISTWTLRDNQRPPTPTASNRGHTSLSRGTLGGGELPVHTLFQTKDRVGALIKHCLFP